MPLPLTLERLISNLKRLPGIGEKSARRMAFYMLQSEGSFVESLSQSIKDLQKGLNLCEKCGNLTESKVCSICEDPLRDRTILCVVESIEDLISIEYSGLFLGIFFVLGTSLSPLEERDFIPEGTLKKLQRQIKDNPVSEVIIATNPRIEGEMTFYALNKVLQNHNLKRTRLAYGLPVGGSIEFADRVTLHAAIESRREIKD